ncbi:CMRF35-like molecule 9 isoform X2 [Perca fluviatilis]|uniref:CMRF35-like molecule 9 isoform X2 n=1 Tax=Perca fluviatilis TaxID=8168 RepID=UPI001962590E|nr:CMRF35-like molecule 9 isoform X2 [Perca fluviatilis]
MTDIFVYSCLLSALSIVEMKPLIIGGRVGENVTFRCSEWNTWMNVESNDKYFCNSPCTEDKHIIIKAAFGETKHKNRIKLTNRAKGLVVTFSNLQKSDSKTYYCGVVRFARDSFIMVNLKVTDAESSSPKTTPETVIDGSTPSFAVSNSSHESLSSSEMITDMARSYMTTTPTASATQGAGSVPYLIIGVIVIITILMVLLKLMRKMRMKQLKFVSSADTPKEDVPEEVECDEIRPEEWTDPDFLYANYSFHQESAAESGKTYSEGVSLNSTSRFYVISRGSCAESRVTDTRCNSVVYSVVQLPKEQTWQSEPNQSESN